tara:strand:+ start:51 stop:1724 length:1674 start_codon:yes stop_codon:yes gene_type:complete
MTNNKILALKYRPQNFQDLIGQEVMAKTITNAIKIKKTPNAYLLTGIRGVGKTTTARLIAKALNCLKNENNDVKCSSENFCHSCEEIVNSNHIDILEMDAASKTGIDDVRELIENSKYSPTSAKFKIFIIDEVHMLSKQAFNGLLKTLEEPPPKLKFILATTEARKIPVTILSRCQRFDLKRVSLDKLFVHIKKISSKEEGKINDNALKLIAKASEGSVRDAISLLDRALITQGTSEKLEELNEDDIRQMLGLADRSKLIFLFKEVLNGNEEDALKILKDLIDTGLDPKNFLNDILEIIYLFTRRLNLGSLEKDMMVSESDSQQIEKYSKKLNMQDLGLFWQLTIKTIDDLKIVSSENITLEMYIMQLVHLISIGNLNENLDKEKLVITHQSNDISENRENDKNENVTNQIKNIDQIKEKTIKNPELSTKADSKREIIKSFNDLINLANKEKEVELKYDLERNVKLVSFSKGKIDISFNEKLNKNFIKLLTEKLLLWTGDRWIISLSKNTGEKTVHEKNLEEQSNKLLKAQNSEESKKILNIFSDAKLIDVSEDNND